MRCEYCSRKNRRCIGAKAKATPDDICLGAVEATLDLPPGVRLLRIHNTRHDVTFEVFWIGPAGTSAPAQAKP